MFDLNGFLFSNQSLATVLETLECNDIETQECYYGPFSSLSIRNWRHLERVLNPLDGFAGRLSPSI